MADSNVYKLDLEQQRLEERISRFLDGEMRDAEAAGFEQEIAASADLQALVAQRRGNDRALREWFRNSVNSAVPAAAQEAVNSIAAVADNSVAESANVVSLWRRVRQPTAIAASVALVLGLTVNLMQQAPQTGTPAMTPALASALEHSPSQADGWESLDDGLEMRAVLTFPAADGAWCREFMVASQESHWRGVACRHDGSWVTQVMGRELFLEQTSYYRPASAETDNQVARFIDQTASGMALGRSQEQALLASGWQSAQ